MSLVSFPYTPSLFVRSRDCEEKSYFLSSDSRAIRSAEVMKKENFPDEDHFPSARWWKKWKGQRRKLDEKNWYSRVLLRRGNCDEICAGKEVHQRSAKKSFVVSSLDAISLRRCLRFLLISLLCFHIKQTKLSSLQSHFADFSSSLVLAILSFSNFSCSR